MRRRRQESRWIHRWSRWMVAGIASVGALGTAFLTINKLTGGGGACPTEGCERVFASPYATIFGLPLTLFGFLAYATMFTLALAPLVINPDQNKVLRQKLEAWTWPLMFMVASSMVVFSAYLMTLLAFEIQAFCPYCVSSALFALAMFGIVLFGNRWDDLGQLAFIGFIVGIVTLTSTLAIYAPIRAGGGGSRPATVAAGQPGPPVTTASGPAEIALANHLNDIGATFYGAWWCPHCHDQKQLFGAEAATIFTYVECAEDGQNPQTALCRSKPEITGFPSWEINGEFYAGTQSLTRLAEISGYTGPMNFQR
ncbi:vitamin K epoxide reductase family protein [Leptolyngbya sp. KIOST-1]|uniref:vitamin K epoxide reductase family protein n=1 Tax=Leptolyngbya sp. KIOST-1 TaxID=1229172 RepID=UPI00055EADAD|nr:vitamin K epoxide reductase family protein [Leptolyngbya sp. KIOST-1]